MLAIPRSMCEVQRGVRKVKNEVRCQTHHMHDAPSLLLYCTVLYFETWIHRQRLHSSTPPASSYEDKDAIYPNLSYRDHYHVHFSFLSSLSHLLPSSFLRLQTSIPPFKTTLRIYRIDINMYVRQNRRSMCVKATVCNGHERTTSSKKTGKKRKRKKKETEQGIVAPAMTIGGGWKRRTPSGMRNE